MCFPNSFADFQIYSLSWLWPCSCDRSWCSLSLSWLWPCSCGRLWCSLSLSWLSPCSCDRSWCSRSLSWLSPCSCDRSWCSLSLSWIWPCSCNRSWCSLSLSWIWPCSCNRSWCSLSWLRPCSCDSSRYGYKIWIYILLDKDSSYRSHLLMLYYNIVSSSIPPQQPHPAPSGWLKKNLQTHLSEPFWNISTLSDSLTPNRGTGCPGRECT